MVALVKTAIFPTGSSVVFHTEILDKITDHCARIIETISSVHNSLGQIPQVIELYDDSIAKYRNINFNQDTSTLRSKIIPPFEGCITEVESIVLKYKKPSSTKKLMTSLMLTVGRI